MKESMVDKYLDELWLRPHVYIYIYMLFLYMCICIHLKYVEYNYHIYMRIF